MSKDMIRLMHAIFLPGADVAAPWQPLTDVYRTSSGWLVKFELAGVRGEDIDLQAMGGRLTLCGQRRDALLEEAVKSGAARPVHYRMEISYSRFERSVELPCDLKEAEIETQMRDGMLIVRVTPNNG